MVSKNKNGSLPSYNLISTTGPEHDPVFEIEININNEQSIRGVGSTKRSRKASCSKGNKDVEISINYIICKKSGYGGIGRHATLRSLFSQGIGSSSLLSRTRKSMKFNVFSIFPELFDNFKQTSLIDKAIREKIISIDTLNIRNHGIGKHRKVDDKVYGGDGGMLIRPDVLSESLTSNLSEEIILDQKDFALESPNPIVVMSAKGEKFTQETARKLSTKKVFPSYVEDLKELIKDL